MEEGVLRDLVQRVPSCHFREAKQQQQQQHSSPTDVMNVDRPPHHHYHYFGGGRRLLEPVQELQHLRQPSLGTILSDLPQDKKDDNDNNAWSSTFSSPLDESALELDISDEESKALQKLAQITDEMTHVDSEVTLQGLDCLSEIEEEEEQVQSDDEGDHRNDEHLNRRMRSLELKDYNDDDDDDDKPARPVMTQSQSQRPIQSNALLLLDKPPRRVMRRNTCGTLYVGSTMSAPDKDATIKVSTPYHAFCEIIVQY